MLELVTPNEMVHKIILNMYNIHDYSPLVYMNLIRKCCINCKYMVRFY